MADGIFDGISNAVGGVGDFFLNRGRYADPNAINQQYGVPEADVRQAGINTLANVSALLLAAGQPMAGSLRAKLLAGIGPAFSGMQSDIFKASQARLMTAQQRSAMDEARGLSALAQRMKTDPEGVGKLIGRDAAFVQANTPKNIMDIMKTLGTRDPVQQKLQQAQLSKLEREAGTAQQQSEARARLAQQMQEDPEGIGSLIGQSGDFVRKSTVDIVMDLMKKTGAQKPTAQFRPEVRTGVDGKPIAGQVNVLTNEWKPISSGGVQILPGEKAEEAEIGKAMAKRRTQLFESAAKAPIEISRLNLAERIAGNIETGKWTNVKSSIVASAKALGLSDDVLRSVAGLDPNLPASQQALTSIFNTSVVGSIGEGGFPANNFSDADRDFLLDIYPKITDEPGSIKIKIEVLRRIEKQKANKASEWRAYQQKERGAGRRPSFEEFEQDYIAKQNDLAEKGQGIFADLVPKIPAAASGGARPAAPLSGSVGGLNWRVEP